MVIMLRCFLLFRYRLFTFWTACKLNGVCGQQDVLIKWHYIRYNMHIRRKEIYKEWQPVPIFLFQLTEIDCQERIQAGTGTLGYAPFWMNETWELKHSYNLCTYVKSQFRFHTAVFSLSWHSFSHINTGTLADGKWTQSQFWCLCVRCSPTCTNQNKDYIWSHDTNWANVYQKWIHQTLPGYHSTRDM